MNVKRIITFAFVFAIVALTVALSGCEKIAPMVPDDTTTMPEMMAGDLPIGVVVSLTGKHAELYGLPMQRGFELAREEINMLSDGNLMFVTVDDQSSEAGAVAAVQGLVDQGVSVIVGIAISDFLEDAFPIAQESGVVAFSSVSSAAGLSSIGDYVFRTPIAVDLMNSRGVMATHEKLGYTKVALIYDAADTYSTSSNEEIKKALAAGGVEILAEETIETDGTDFTAQLTNIMNAAPDALFVSALSPEMMRVIMQAGELGIPDTVQLIVPDLTPAEIQQVGDAAEGAIAFSGRGLRYGLTHLETKPSSRSIRAKHDGVEAGPWAAQAYATLHILANAIANARSADAAGDSGRTGADDGFPDGFGQFLVSTPTVRECMTRSSLGSRTGHFSSLKRQHRK